MPRVKRGDQPGQFPDNDIAMANYDAIVLGEVPPEQFTQADADWIADFVTRGGGLIVIDGRFNRIPIIARERLAALIPVRHTGKPPFVVKSIEPTELVQIILS